MATPEPEPVQPEHPDDDQGFEPENPDAEPDEDAADETDEVDEPAAPHVPSSQTMTEERDKAMNAAAKSHETRLKNVLGLDFDNYMPCPLCLGDAFLVPTPPGQMSPEQWEAIQLAAGTMRDENLKHADYAEMCDTCDGYGQVLTGSKSENQVTVPCRTCEGKGWKAKLTEVPPPQPFVFTPPQTTGNAWTPPLNASLDAWDRPAGHPHFGIPPALAGLAS